MTRPDPSPILFDTDGPPRSRLYDDLYFSRDDGLAESRAVFLSGCGLPERWAGRRGFAVAELGFGAGLNVLALLDLWRTTRPADGHLSIFSVEAHPISAEEAAAAIAPWPELAPVAEPLLARWPGRRPGFHRVDLPELDATLDVAVMDAADALAAWSGPADAWFLDGFAPARNPAMWTDELMKLVAERSAPGAIAATYTVAGQVRRALAAAGFEVERRPGFGKKRERLVASLAPRPSAAENGRTVAIIGAGIAGASLARAFAALGVKARVFEAEGVGAGASGNPAAVVTPRLDAGLGPGAQLYVQAFDRAIALHGAVPGAVIARGALQLENDPRDTDRFARIAGSDIFEAGAVEPLTAEAMGEILGGAAAAGLRFPEAPVVEPMAVLGAWLGEVAIVRVAEVRRADDGFELHDSDGERIACADMVCLAAGAELAALWPQAPITPVRGQLSWAIGMASPMAVSWGGYAAPMKGGMLFGATHDRGDTGTERRAVDDRRNLAELTARLPGLAERLEGAALEGRASVRASPPDNFPLAGAIAPGLFVLGALSGRGFTLAPLLAEHVAAIAVGAPSPLPEAIAKLIDPARFAERARRRERLATRTYTL